MIASNPLKQHTHLAVVVIACVSAIVMSVDRKKVKLLNPCKIAVLIMLLSVLFFTPAQAAQQSSLNVVTTLAPINNLVAAVMGDLGEPIALLPTGASVHDYVLRPSDARALYNAAVIFWVGPELEGFMPPILANISDTTTVVSLINTPKLPLWPLRSSTLQSSNDTIDPHIWLSPMHAQIMIDHIAAVLSQLEPQQATYYQNNAKLAQQRLTALDHQLKTLLRPVQQQPFIVFHDAFQYLEQAYGLNAQGVITFNPEQPTSARRILTIQQQIRNTHIRCIFIEPQYNPGIIKRLTENSPATQHILDPIGPNLVPPSLTAYENLLIELAKEISRCLSVTTTSS